MLSSILIIRQQEMMADKGDSSAIWFSMNDDALMEILVRVPAKSLIRFKSVCKKWLSLISSDYLRHRHTLLRPKPQPSLLLYVPLLPGSDDFFYLNQTEKTIIPYTPFTKSSSLDPDVPHKIVQSCNGLLLLVSKYRAYGRATKNRHRLVTAYNVFNPTTKQSREILSENVEYPSVAAMGLAFDPCISPYYKMVCIRSRDPYFQIEVYDSESPSWKKVTTVEALTSPPILSLGGVHWNNSLYWQSSNREYFCFDIAKNEIKTLPFPQTARGRGHYPESYLQECNGHLYHFEWISESLSNRGGGVAEAFHPIVQSIAVWELGGNNQWLSKYRHNLGHDKKNNIRNLIRLTVGSDDETCRLLSYCRAGKMKAYNFLTKTWEEDLFQFQETYTNSVLGFQFGEVLALV